MTPPQEAILAELYQANFGKARHAARRIVLSDTVAEDVASQAFERLAEHMERNPQQESYAVYWRLLGLITHGLAVDEYRRRLREMTFADTEVDIWGGLEADDVRWVPAKPITERGQIFSTGFDAALRALPAPERQAFIATELRGLNVREAGDVLDVHYSTVSRRAETARTFIREEIQQ